MADKFLKGFGSFIRRIIDMGDGTFSERVVAAPPPDMVVDGRLLVDAEMDFPPAMLNGDRLKVDLDEPIAVTLPANPLPVSGTVAISGTVPVSVTGQPIAVSLPASPLPVSVPGTVAITLPAALLTDGGGPSTRLRVDQGETGFFAGKMFRAFFNGLIPKAAGSSIRFRFTSPIDFILWVQELDLTQGALQLEVFTGATPSGTWVSVPVIGVNRMAQRPLPYYNPQVTIDTSSGGTGDFTGGTRVDFLQNRTASTNGTASNVGVQFSERGLPAGTYYGRLQTLAGGLPVNDDSQFVYRLQWEERP